MLNTMLIEHKAELRSVKASGFFWCYERVKNEEPKGLDMYPEFWTHIYELG